MNERTRWAVEHTTDGSSGVRFFDSEEDAQEWASKQAECYGAVTWIVSFEGEYPPDGYR